MVSLDKAKMILESKGTAEYTNEDVKKTLEYLTKMAEIAYCLYKKSNVHRLDNMKYSK